MTELINGRTAEEFKTELAYCASMQACTESCPHYHAQGCMGDLIIGSNALIDRLESRIAELEAKQPKWISVEERLPESGVHVFVLCEIRANGGVIRRYVCDGFHVEAWKEKAGCHSEDCALVYNDEDDEYYLEEGWYEVIKNWEEYNSVTIADFVTHWMLLPKPPKEGE